jgi:hypothetical protein
VPPNPPRRAEANTSVRPSKALRDEHREAIEALTPRLEACGRYASYIAWHLGAGHALIGEFDGAFTWLRHAADLGFVNYPFLLTDPLLERLRGEDRFGAFAEQVRMEWHAFEV